MKVGHEIITFSIIAVPLFIICIAYATYWYDDDSLSFAAMSNREIIVSNFQSGHGFTKQSGTGSQINDPNDFVVGEQSLKLVTNGHGSAVFSRKSNISPAIDFNNKLLKLWIKVNDTRNISELRVTVTSDNFQSYKSYWIHGGTNNAYANYMRNNEWNVITISPTQTTSFGSPDISQINSIQIKAVDRGAGPVAVWLNGLSIITKHERAIVSFAFDDGYETDYTTARPILDRYHFHASSYVVTGKIGTPGRMTLDELKTLQDLNGWDVSSHTIDHLDLTSLNSTDVERELLLSKQFLIDNGLRKGSEHFAYPYGGFDDESVKEHVQKYYKTARTTKGTVETLPPGDPYRLRVMIVTNSTSPDDIMTRVNEAAINGDWLILVFHKIVDSDANAETKYQKANFEIIVDRIRETGIDVMTISEVYTNHYD